jgi:hypothetical protein
MNEELTDFLDGAYCLDHILHCFFKEAEIPLFLLVQAHTGALIGGAIVLKFLMQLQIDRSAPLTIYVQQQFEEAVRVFLATVRYGPLSSNSESPLLSSLEGFKEGWCGGIYLDWDFPHSRFDLIHSMAVFTKEDKDQPSLGV